MITVVIVVNVIIISTVTTASPNCYLELSIVTMWIYSIWQKVIYSRS